MSERETIEKMRQEIMRFRELLTVMRQYTESGERAYQKLFDGFSEAEKAEIKEKDLQWKAAEALSPEGREKLSRAVMEMQFHARDLERNFEELFGIIASPIKVED